jgi:hypothetical protein
VLVRTRAGEDCSLTDTVDQGSQRICMRSIGILKHEIYEVPHGFVTPTENEFASFHPENVATLFARASVT